jgi:homopolymeric O-antigen transport system permease protein
MTIASGGTAALPEPTHLRTDTAAGPSDRASLGGLVWTLVRTDFKARYHGTPSGFLWALLKPAAMFLVLVTVFSLIFTDQANYRLNLIIGLFLWDFFSEGTKTGMTSLHAKGFLLTKARFPAWILVVVSMSNALITLTVFSIVIAVFLAWSGQAPGAGALVLFVVYLLHMVAIVAGFSLATSVLFLRYRDLNQVWDVVTQAGFFVAPIIYPLGVIPERFHLFIYLWPPTSIIEFSRAVLVGGHVPTWQAHADLTLMAGASLSLGAWVFRRFAPRAAEYL